MGVPKPERPRLVLLRKHMSLYHCTKEDNGHNSITKCNKSYLNTKFIPTISQNILSEIKKKKNLSKNFTFHYTQTYLKITTCCTLFFLKTSPDALFTDGLANFETKCVQPLGQLFSLNISKRAF